MEQNDPAIDEILALKSNQEEKPTKQDILQLNPEDGMSYKVFQNGERLGIDLA